ncbi:hypothetical protein Vadar_016366 [Vaccinium darrowii]|uniref:Uncharacterized protein n=1 Tax=Vaccinium darrowii TaxID=229202 RepID=A0ACB7XAF4_9ERIC|nr:hypothetical protein Vadar_016366 [Vaccinium darrowii]
MESKKQYRSRLNWLKNRTSTPPPLFYFFTLTVFSLSFFFFFSSAFAILDTTKTTPCQDRMIRCQMTGTKADMINIQESENLFKKIIGKKEMMMPKSTKSEVSPMSLTAITRRFLGGPGSWPPRCTSKCGRCSPCKPVHVPVPPGTPVTTEYYPEAWRCKCGNRLFMP